MRYSILFFSCFFVLQLWVKPLKATHNRSGEITYSYLYGNTYRLRVITYTNNGSGSIAADRCVISLFIDNLLDSISLPRVNGAPATNCTDPTAKMGEDLNITPAPPTGGYRKNIYETTYTFQGSGMHVLYMFDPNRNAGSLNIPNSVNVPFALVDTIYTYNQPGLNYNNSPVLTFPPIDNACAGQLFTHNPGAYDPDLDSLSYSLTSCLGNDGLPIQNYVNPASLGVSIDQNGNLIWNVPQSMGEYNFAILITEWRKDKDGYAHVVGKTLRDLQVLVHACQNQAPVIKPIKDTCIIAGTTLVQPVSATDPNAQNRDSLQAEGSPFHFNPFATFSSTPGYGSATGVFTWTPSCGQVSVQPYVVTFKVKDNGSPINLVDFESFRITVVGPPPQNLSAKPSGSSIILNWNAPPACTPGPNGNSIVNYLVYRKNDCNPFTPNPCPKGTSLPGFTLIGNLFAYNNPPLTFTDNNNGAGLAQGVYYSYVVVAQFADGALSMASVQACELLTRDVPIMINVSVDTTDNGKGEMWLRWVKPVISTALIPSLDTIANPGPYEFRLMQQTGFSGAAYTEVYKVNKLYFAQLTQLSDTTFTSLNLDTKNNPYTYKVDFYCNGVLKGSTQTASSVFLTATGLARRIQLNWKAQVPWINYKTYIYKEKPGGGYLLKDSVFNSTQYVDTGLVNGKNYCYKVVTYGQYSGTGIHKPLINWSQKVCASPVDKEPPCAPDINDMVGNCTSQITSFTWTNPNNSCCDDAILFNIYYTPVIDSPFVKITTLPITVTSYQTDFAPSIAGCYAVTAVDSFYNESPLSIKVCVDNCPEYELPNIITINGDGKNDTLIPVKNKFVRDISLKIYDRWGTLVFESKDAAIRWNGHHKDSGNPCSDGTYYYVCDVHMIRLKGIETKTLKGFIQILRN